MRRIGVLGAGRIGAVHAANFTGLGAKVTVVEPDPERRAAIASQAEAVASFAELGEMDGLVIACPTDLHLEVAKEALLRRVPLLVEKPVTGDARSTQLLGTLAEAAGVPLHVGFQRRFADENLKMREEYLGRSADIDLAVFTSLDGCPPPDDYEVAGGSLAFDLQIHDIDLMFWLFDSAVERIAAQSKPTISGGLDTELLLTILTLRTGTLCNFTAKRLNPGGCITHAQLVSSSHVTDNRAWQDSRAYLDFRDRYAAAYQAEADEFLRLVCDASASLATWRDGMRAEAVCAQIDEYLRSTATAA